MRKIEVLGLQSIPEIKQAAVSALVFRQTGAGIPVAIIRGCEYEINETANVANSLVPTANNGDITQAIKATMRATSCARGPKERLLLRIASLFV